MRNAPKDITNKEFERLTAKYRTIKTKYGWKWFCECLCGNTCEKSIVDLNRGHAKSCGCLKKDQIKIIHLNNTREKHPAWTGYKEISGSIWASIKASAKQRKIDFQISIEQAWDLYEAQNRKCALSGVDIAFSNSYKGITTASLDRIDSNKDYTIDNVQWLHQEINYMKQWYNQNQFINWCKIIAKYQEKN